MKMLKGLAVGLAGLVVVLAGVGFLLPEQAHVERSVVTTAAPETVFPLLNNLHEFNRWSPWSDLDPNMTTQFEGPDAGVGAKMSWAGNSAVGTGSQQIIESMPNRRVVTRLAFGGYDHPSTATFTLTPEGKGTRVVWAYDTSMGYDLVSRYFGLMLDRWVGNDYARGLSVLARLAESQAGAPAPETATAPP